MSHCGDQGIELLASLFKLTAVECGANADTATKKLFEDLVLDEERHFGRFDDEVENVERFGQSCLAQQAMERSRAAAGLPGNGA